MVAQYLLQGIVEQVGGCMVGGTGIALVNIHTCHKVGCRVFRQLLNDMYALVVLTLGVDDLNCLILADEYSTVSYLSSHLAIERGVVEDEFVETLLLLSHLAIAEDMTLIFCIVITLELLLAFSQHLPVAILNSGGITCAGFLLLHLHVESCLVNGISVFTTDKFGEVERESVGVEHAECLGTVEHCLAMGFQLVHGSIEQVDTLIKCAEERVFLFLHHAANEFTLCNEFGICTAHLSNEYGEELIHECFLLIEEGVGIAHGTTEDSADNISCLGIAGQLSVGN